MCSKSQTYLPSLAVRLTVTTAILDRVLHHSHIINIQGDSYRLKEKQESGLIDSDIFKIKEDLLQKSNEN